MLDLAGAVKEYHERTDEESLFLEHIEACG